MMQFLIAVDQLLNTLVYAKHEGFGFADETVSARAWRLRRSFFWYNVMRNIDLIFGQHHCKNSYEAECLRMQLPTKYCDE